MAQRSGLLPVPEGHLFWRLSTPASESAAARPALLFFHAGVTDCSVWDDQVAALTQHGWTCLVVDRFGFGQSRPSAAWLAQEPRSKVDINAHWQAVIREALPGAHRTVVVIGLSMGGAYALEFALDHPALVVGVVSVAGGLPGFDCPIPDLEKQCFEQEEQLSKAKDVEGLAQYMTQFWANGPGQPADRAPQSLRDRMMAWNRDICGWEVAGTGGGAIDTVQGHASLLGRLGELRVPLAVAWGKFDETSTNEGLKYLAKTVPGTASIELEAAHIPPVEQAETLNLWLLAFLAQHFP